MIKARPSARTQQRQGNGTAYQWTAETPPKRLRSRLRRPLAALLALLLLAFGSLYLLRSHTGEGRSSSQHVRRYIDGVISHPVHTEDWTSFAQMGLRTRMYVNFLQDPTMNATDLDRFEAALWNFVPRIRHLRQARLSRRSLKKRRGIVLTAGKDNFEYALHLIATVRNAHKSTLPIELYYYSDEDLPADMAKYLHDSFVDVEAIDLSIHQNPYNESITGLQNAGWAMKPFALLASGFDEAMMVDSDTVLLLPPEQLFQSTGYRKTRTLFFHDRIALCNGEKGDFQEMHNFIIDQLGSEGPPPQITQDRFWTERCPHHQESGLLIVDLTEPGVLASLLLTTWMNTRAVRDFHTYKHFHGDKESFWLAFALTQQPYHFNKDYGGSIGSEYATNTDGFCTDHILHMIDDLPAQVERRTGWHGKASDEPASPSRPAWINGSLRRTKFHAKQLMVPQESIWAIDGNWEWNAESNTLCFKNFEPRSLDEFGLDDTLSNLIEAAKSAEDEAIRKGILKDNHIW